MSDDKGPAFLLPLNSQRYKVAFDEIKKINANFVIDFGCNECDFIFYLSRNPKCLKFIIGLDKDKYTLSKGYKYLMRFQNMSNISEKVTEVFLKQADITNISDDFVNQYKNCPIMTMIELIEHLSLEQVDVAMEQVLGRMKPQKLILTTPNIEYNHVIGEFYGRPSQYKFRHRDHKFEWTRQEFSEWVSKIASKYNYSVEISGIGCVSENEDHSKFGYASHCAIFSSSDEIKTEFTSPTKFDFQNKIYGAR